MRIERTRQDPSPDPGRPPTFVTDDTHWWDGSQIYGRDPAFAAGDPLGRAREAAAGRGRAHPARHRGAHRPLGRCGQLLGRPRALALPVHARAQRDLRPPARDPSGARRRRALRQGAARRRRADGQDPHRRLDAGDHRSPDVGSRPAGELVGPRGRETRQALRPHYVERGDPRHPGLADEPPRRPLFAHRRVRRRLPHAPADPGRLQLPLARKRCRASGAHARGARRAARARAAERDVDGRRCSTRSAPRILARSPCTTSHASSRTSTARTGRTSIWPRSTSCACASAACRATTSSGGCST